MTASSFGFLGIFGFAVLIGQIIGVIGLAKAGRAGDWWLMTIGLACTVLGSLASVIMMFSSAFGPGSASFLSSGVGFWIALSGLSMLGSILFGAGFAWHGMKATRVSSRQSELEMLVRAQSEEIQRLSLANR